MFTILCKCSVRKTGNTTILNSINDKRGRFLLGQDQTYIVGFLVKFPNYLLTLLFFIHI